MNNKYFHPSQRCLHKRLQECCSYSNPCETYEGSSNNAFRTSQLQQIVHNSIVIMKSASTFIYRFSKMVLLVLLDAFTLSIQFQKVYFKNWNLKTPCTNWNSVRLHLLHNSNPCVNGREEINILPSQRKILCTTLTPCFADYNTRFVILWQKTRYRRFAKFTISKLFLPKLFISYCRCKVPIRTEIQLIQRYVMHYV